MLRPAMSQDKQSMYCKVAELIVEVPNAGGLAPRCAGYLCKDTSNADITINTDLYRNEIYDPSVKQEIIAYIESGRQFLIGLLNYEGVYLHSSAVALDNKAYLFSAPCGTGKSTHTRLWQQVFGEAAQVFNDDKPALRYLDDVWYAYGTPWCGKDGININTKVPVAGICFLKQGPENKIRRMSKLEAAQRIIGQTIFKFDDASLLDKLLVQVEKLVAKIPVFEMENRPEPDAVKLSYETMHRAAEECGL